MSLFGLPPDSRFDPNTGRWYGWVTTTYWDSMGRRRVVQHWGIVR
jgi:hypothetical protein